MTPDAHWRPAPATPTDQPEGPRRRDAPARRLHPWRARRPQRALLAALICCAPYSMPEVASARSEVLSPLWLLSHRAVVERGAAVPGRLARLPLTAEVLERCRGDLSDLRLLHGDRLIPTYLRREAITARQVTRVEAEVLSARRDALGSSSGDPLSQFETYELAAPDAWTNDGSWRLELRVDPDRVSYARDVELAWTEGDATPGQLAASPRIPAQRTETLFRFADGRERSLLDLPPRTARRLRVVLVGPDRSTTLDPLEPRFFFVRHRQAATDPPLLETELELQPADEEGFSHRATLPAGFLADALRFETRTGNFLRRVTVGERTVAGSVEVLTHGWIQSSDHPDRTQTVSLQGTRSRGAAGLGTDPLQLLLDIDGGDSPPLEALRVFAVLPQPELVFEWPAEVDNLDLLFGGGRVRPARFDLDLAAARRWFPGAGAEQTWELLGNTSLPAARLGAVEANPRFDPAPTLGFLQRPGAALDIAAFRHRAPLVLPTTDVGLYRIPLPPALLSNVREDFADLRFVPSGAADEPDSEQSPQWPYLVEPDSSWTVDLVVGEPERVDGRTTRTRFELPAALRAERPGALRPRSIRIVFDQPYFDRDVLFEVLAGDRAIQQTFRRLTTSSPRDAFYDPLRATSSIALSIEPVVLGNGPLTAFAVEVHDGDDAPVRIAHAELTGDGWQALLVAPPGAYEALVGATGTMPLDAPDYELQRAADFVTALRGTEVELGDIAPNPAAAAPSWLARLGDGWQQIALWCAILLAILALGWITLRSVRA